MSRLTDAEINLVDYDNQGRDGRSFTSAARVQSMAIELRERRALDLSADDREALKWLQDPNGADLRCSIELGMNGRDYREHMETALAILARLTEAG